MLPSWFLLTFLTSTLVESNPHLLQQIIFFPTDLALISAAYSILLRLIVECLFAAANLLFEGWDPGPDARRPSTRRKRRRRPRYSPHHQRWNTGSDACHPPSVCRHLRHRRKRYPSSPITSINRLVVGLLCGVFGTHDANPPVHHLPWTPCTSIH